MYLFLRCLLAALLSTGLVESPLLASPAAVLGQVTQAEHARIGSAEVVPGATVYSGDVLATDVGGKLGVRVSTAQFYLMENSTATLSQLNTGASATLERGSLLFSSNGTEGMEVRASGARIRPRAQPHLTLIMVVNPCEILVTSQRGSVEVDVSSEIRTVEEGASYRVLPDHDFRNVPCAPQPAAPAAPGRGVVQPAARSHFLAVALIGIGVATGVIVWRALVSPDKP